MQHIPLMEADAKKFINLYISEANMIIEEECEEEFNPMESDKSAAIIAYLTNTS